MKTPSLLSLLALLVACRGKATDTEDGSLTDDTADAIVDQDGDGVPADEDCDDRDHTVSPSAAEVPYNGVDDDCDPTSPDDDLDGDGYGIAEDCDDGAPEVFPGAVEVCNGVDDDCSGVIDDSAGDWWYADADGDGYGDPGAATQDCDGLDGSVADGTDCDDTDDTAFPGGVEVCDEADNDCDGVVDEDVTTTYYQDTDDDGFGISGTTTESCDRPTGYAAAPGDCDDSRDDIHPEADERCNDADDDCDGTVDEDDAIDAGTFYADADADGYADVATATRACAVPSGYLAYTPGDALDCDDSDSAISPAAAEVCNAQDDDCDGLVDDDDPGLADGTTFHLDYDGDGYGGTRFTTRACEAPSGYVDNSDDCDDTHEVAFPGGTEVCDSLDNDCDGTTDEDDATDAPDWYADADGDGHGDADDSTAACTAPSGYVESSDDCDDTTADARPGGAEVCDGIDNNCDGTADEGAALDAETFYADADADGYGDADDRIDACTVPSGYVENGDDCDDTDALLGLTVARHADADGDGYGDAGDRIDACGEVSGYVDDAEDCDDSDDTVRPDAEEVCDGIDNNCDGTADEDDAVYGDGSTCAAESCQDILDTRPDADDGLYWIDPDGAGAFAVSCDMATDGGGWTQIIAASQAEIDASNPPDFNYTSSVWSSGYGSAGDSTHISEAWLRTPTFSELMWVEGTTAYTETASTSGSLSAWSKTTGTIHLNELNSHSYGSYGGRVFRIYVSAICNTANASTSWGAGLGAVRSCQHTYGTLYYELSNYSLGYTSAELWIR